MPGRAWYQILSRHRPAGPRADRAVAFTVAVRRTGGPAPRSTPAGTMPVSGPVPFARRGASPLPREWWRTARARVAGVLCAVAAAATVATAQPPGDGAVARPLDPRAEQVIAETMSPYCPGSTLATCTSPQAESLRVAVRARIAAGETPASVRAGLVSVFGDQVRGAPAPAGFGLVAYLAPAVLLVVGGALLTRWLRRSTGVAAARGASPATAHPAPSPAPSPVRPPPTP